ncbi:hypothetical protein ACIA8C_33790 [Nocardia sp. NPDC051321]|uniref:hypothetical protein n=1 Tax=Nocardia sp. NPDC051321 TaxID=3364323 RepID=UPI003792BE08
MRRPSTPRYVLILETTVLAMIAAGLTLARLSTKSPGGVTIYLFVGAVLAGLAAFGAFHGARRARDELERQNPDDTTLDP